MKLQRILFVDDEPQVLDGLQNLLRKHRRVWDMAFCVGAEAALEEMARNPVDVIVSDMRMPGMDGAALLEHVKQKYPSVARIVLSGHAEREAILRALPVAHQFLSKPCDADTMRIVIERTCSVQNLLQDAALREVIGRLDKLPSVPTTYWELTRAVAEPNVEIATIAKIIEKDPAMSIKVLQLVNSAYFGLAHRMTSVNRAVTYLGIELVKGLALMAQVFTTMEASPASGFSIAKLQECSLATGRVAGRFQNDSKLREEAFTAGLVHDIGKMIIAVAMPARYAEVVQNVRETHRPFHAVESEVLGLTHAAVGACLLGTWGLPFSIVEAVAFHHSPGLVTEGACEVLAGLHVADALVDASCFGEMDDPSVNTIDETFLERVGLIERLPEWRTQAAEEIAKLVAAAR